MSAISMKSLPQKLNNKRYRDAYVGSRVRNWIAYQIRTIRNQRGMSQIEFAKAIGKPQSVISRMEDPSYGKLTVQTLLEVAAAFNAALIIKIVDFPTFIRQTSDVSQNAMEVEEYNTGQFSPQRFQRDIGQLTTQVDESSIGGLIKAGSTDVMYRLDVPAGNRRTLEDNHV